MSDATTAPSAVDIPKANQAHAVWLTKQELPSRLSSVVSEAVQFSRSTSNQLGLEGVFFCGRCVDATHPCVRWDPYWKLCIVTVSV